MEIVGYNNYLIYPDGKVYCKKTKTYVKTSINSGYKQVNLNNDGKGKQFKIHRLVALHYIPNPENKPQVDHWNRHRSDNRVENLRWVTASENQQNTGISKSNKSGHKNIYYNKNRKKWGMRKEYDKKVFEKFFNTKTEALCFKFVILLKIKCKLI
jgi:hypothetical protein